MARIEPVPFDELSPDQPGRAGDEDMRLLAHSCVPDRPVIRPRVRLLVADRRPCIGVLSIFAPREPPEATS